MTAQRYLWLIDAGHAPETPGKRSPDGRLLEWQFAREVAGLVAAALDRRGVASHVLTPHTDYDLPPSKRAQLANAVAERVPLPCRLVSVHANASGGDGWSEPDGLTVLHYPTSSTSESLARVFLDELARATGWRDRGLRPRDDLTLLKATSMPAVLTECGFYTNEAQCAALLDPSTRQRIAEAHVAAVLRVEESGVA